MLINVCGVACRWQYHLYRYARHMFFFVLLDTFQAKYQKIQSKNCICTTMSLVYRQSSSSGETFAHGGDEVSCRLKDMSALTHKLVLLLVVFLLY